jgi:hypothetical protein
MGEKVAFLKPSVYSLNDFKGIIRKNKLDIKQILAEINNPLIPFIPLPKGKATKCQGRWVVKRDGDDSLPLVYETKKTCDLSYAGTLFLAKQKDITAEVYVVSKMSARFVSVAKATNPTTKITQFGAASYPITLRFSDEVIRHIVGRLALRNAIEKVIPRQEALVFIYQARLSDNGTDFH